MEERCIVTDLSLSPALIFRSGGTDGLLEAMQKELDSYVPDVSTSAGRKDIASFSRKFSSSKTLVDRLGKSLKAEHMLIVSPIDWERKKFRDRADEMRDIARKPLTDWEADQDRIEAVKKALEEYARDYDEAILMNGLFDREREIKRKEDEQREIEIARTAKEESERVERERVERESRLKKDAAENAIRESKKREEQLERDVELAELKRIENIKRVENERIEAARSAEREKHEALARQHREHEKKERIERERVAEEERIAEEKAANRSHQKVVNNKVVQKFVAVGISESEAVEIVKDIIRNPIEEISINY